MVTMLVQMPTREATNRLRAARVPLGGREENNARAIVVESWWVAELMNCGGGQKRRTQEGASSHRDRGG